MTIEQTSDPKRVLVTGAAGAVGQPICRYLLTRGHHVRGFDRRPMPELDDVRVADLIDREAVRAAAEGMDAIIHLGAYPDEADFLENLIEPNVRGLYHVCDAARQSSVTRLVLASSVQTISGHFPAEGTIRVADGPKPVNHYALTKVWMEQMGEMYARCYGLSVINVRIGWFPRNTTEAKRLAASERGPDVFLSHEDGQRFFARCVESPTPEIGDSVIVFAGSQPQRARRHGSGASDAGAGL